MRKLTLFATLGIITVMVALSVDSVSAQIPPVNDAYRIRSVVDSRYETVIYESTPGVILYRFSDLLTDAVLTERAATEQESTAYINGRLSRIKRAAIEASKANLTGDILPGSKYFQFVQNNTQESINCVDDMDTALNLPAFNSLSPNAQNQVITGLITCVRHAEFVNSKLLPNLYDLLVASEIIAVVDPSEIQ